MKTQTRPFKVEVKSKRRPVQSSMSSVNWGMSADEGAPRGMPSRDSHKSGSARSGSGTAFDEASRVFGAFVANTVSAAASMSELASAIFAPRSVELTPTPSGEAVQAEARQGPRILPSLDPVSIPQPDVAGESTPKPRASRPRKAKATQVVTAAPEVVAEGAVKAVADGVGKTPPVTLVEAPIQQDVPDPLGTRRWSRKTRIPAGERWKRRRLPKLLW
jgi:hypothetical protein